MDFSSLVKGVQDFWDFIWPPILCLIALFGITSYVAPSVFGKIQAKLAGLRPTDQRQIQFVKISKRFGFDKLLPIICAFFLIFFLDVARNLVVMGGQAIPPVVSYSPSGLLLEDKDWSTIRCLWESRAEAVHLQKEATIKAGPPLDPKELVIPPDDGARFYIDPRYGFVGFEDVSQIIESAVTDAEAQHKDAPPVLTLHNAAEGVGIAHMTFSALKFLMVYTLILFLFEMRWSSIRLRVLFRAALLMGLLMAGTVGYLLRYLKMVQDVEQAKISISQRYPVKGSMDCEFPDAERRQLDKLYNKTVRQEQNRPTKWWSLQFPRTTVFTWSWKQLTEQHPGPSYAP